MSRGLPDQGDFLAVRFAHHLLEGGPVRSGDRIMVALSGGVDSTVLLHLLRFLPGLPELRLCAAHFDHRMRPDSGEDLHWVKGLCRAWGVDLLTGSPGHPPTSEDEAREERYGFLLRMKKEEDAALLLTGHHADDQVETVLFRIFRGTGLRGLAGIPASRPPGLFRPLLPFSRNELLAYAGNHRVPYRTDPTNSDTTYSRNFLRHEVLPLLDGGPIPGAREAVRRLARLAGENEEAWRSLLPGLLEGVCRKEEGQLFIVRSGLLAYHPALQKRLLREVFQEGGIDLDEAGTRAVLEFTRSGVSGGSFSLPGGYRLAREFELLRLHEPDEVETAESAGKAGKVGRAGTVGRAEKVGRAGNVGTAGSQGLVLPTRETGNGVLCLDGKGFEVEWGPARPERSDDLLEVPSSVLEFPLILRGWEPGDRIQLPYGTKKLKKLFGEARIPVQNRMRIPVLLDSRHRVLWVVGLASSALSAAPRAASHRGELFFVGIRNVDQS